jgi:predicted SnoaL-like aldol condensation-catalyzing enzyme
MSSSMVCVDEPTVRPARRHRPLGLGLAVDLGAGIITLLSLASLQLIDMENDMTKTTPEQNKALVLEAFDTLFNKRDYEAAARFWSESYIQHSAHIEPGRDGLLNLIRSAPETLRYEHQLIVAEGDYVIVHGRFTGNGRSAAWVAADVVRIEDGRLAEHWDVLQDEATKAESKSGRPMFRDQFPG